MRCRHAADKAENHAGWEALMQNKNSQNAADLVATAPEIAGLSAGSGFAQRCRQGLLLQKQRAAG